MRRHSDVASPIALMRESAGDEFTQPMLQALLAELKQISSVQAKHDQILLKLQQQQQQQLQS